MKIKTVHRRSQLYTLHGFPAPAPTRSACNPYNSTARAHLCLFLQPTVSFLSLLSFLGPNRISHPLLSCSSAHRSPKAESITPGAMVLLWVGHAVLTMFTLFSN